METSFLAAVTHGVGGKEKHRSREIGESGKERQSETEIRKERHREQPREN